MASTANLGATKPVSEQDAQKVVTYNTLADDYDSAIAGMLTLSVAGGAGDTALTRAQALNKIYKFTGAITGNRTVSLPTISAGAARHFVVWNATTGAFTLTIKTAAGTGIAVTQGKVRVLFHDGTNVLDAVTEAGALSLTTANLSDYTATTFTPVIAFGGGTTGITYTTQLGTYRKIGDLVFIDIRITLSAKGSSTGTVALTGLPFTVANVANQHWVCAIYINSASFTGSGIGLATANTTLIGIYASNGGTMTQLDDTNITNTTDMILSLIYRAA